MQSHYEINVSKKGIGHLFATHPRSISATDTKKFEEMIVLFKEKFPESEGYKISATRWEGTGHMLEI